MTTFKRSNRIYATAIRIDPDPCWFPSTGGRIDLPPPLVAERGERVDLAARLELADRRDEIRPREGRHPENPDEFARLLDGSYGTIAARPSRVSRPPTASRSSS